MKRLRAGDAVCVESNTPARQQGVTIGMQVTSEAIPVRFRSSSTIRFRHPCRIQSNSANQFEFEVYAYRLMVGDGRGPG